MERPETACFEEAVDYLYRVPKFAAKNSMEDTKEVLRLLGNPEQKMKLVHVAGTNGKGSVCAYLRGILEEAGYTCAVFTSPHLIDIRERFVISGRVVSKEAFLEAFLKVYDLIGDARLRTGYHPSFFEYLFFMALLLFSKEDGEPAADYVILETGLGGRLDATNSVSGKKLTVITQIGPDHMEYLGDTEEKIAWEKAGIMEEKVPVVFLEDSTAAAKVIRKRACKLGSPCFSLSKNNYAFLNFKNKNIDFSYQSRYYGYVRLCLHTTAFYQIQNAALAALAAEVLLGKENLTGERIANGVAKVHWPGRMEEILPGIYVDGAHNEDGIRAFLKSVSQDGCEGERFLIFSAVADKQYEKMISLIFESGFFEHIIFTKISNSRGLSGETFQQIANAHKQCRTGWAENSREALRMAAAEKKKPDVVYAAGSLYLVGEVKAAAGQGVSND